MSFFDESKDDSKPQIVTKDFIGAILNKGDFVAVFPKGKYGRPHIGVFAGPTKTGMSIRVFQKNYRCRNSYSISNYSDASYMVKMDSQAIPQEIGDELLKQFHQAKV